MVSAETTNRNQTTIEKGPTLKEKVQAIIDAAGAEEAAVALYDFGSKTTWSSNGDVWFHAASTIKVPVLVALMSAVFDGRLSLESRLHVRNRFLSVHDGSAFSVASSRDANSAVQRAIGKTMKVRELATHMIATSSNLATNLLLEAISLQYAQEVIERLHMTGIKLMRGVEDELAYDAGISNEVTADGLLGLFRMVAEARLFTSELCKEILDILHQQEFKSGIPAGLPSEARVAHKTGEISTVAHDAGIVFLPDREPYVLVILTRWKAESGGGRQETVSRLSKLVYETVVEGGAS